MRVVMDNDEPADIICQVGLKWAVNCFAKYILHVAMTPSYVIEEGLALRLSRTSVYKRILATDSVSELMLPEVFVVLGDRSSWAGLVVDCFVFGDKEGRLMGSDL
eukprot:13236536-Ditylum_brightwellii.AAC.1